MIPNFHQWLEAKANNWHDFEASRGRIHHGYNLSSGNSPMVPASDDKNVKDALLFTGNVSIHDFKMLHDRMLDAIEIKPQDLALFIKHMLGNIPGDSVKVSGGYTTNPEFSEMKLNWSLAIDFMKEGGIDHFSIKKLENAMKDTSRIAHQDTPAGHYFKQLFPLIKSIIQHLKSYSATYRKVVDNRRTDSRAWDKGL